MALTEFTGRRVLLSITLLVMIMPASALVLPLFLEMNLLNLLNTPWSVILPFGFFPFGVFLSYIFFSSTIPKELLAAARVDGCSEWGVFRWVALPLARPIVALVGFFAFVFDWTNFFLPYVMFYNDRQYPLPVGLQYLVSSTSAFNPTVGLGQSPSPPARTGDSDARGDRAGLHRLPLRPTSVDDRDAGRSDEGMTSAGSHHPLVACLRCRCNRR